MTIPPLTHPFIASTNERITHCVRCGLAETHPIHGTPPVSTSVDERGLTTDQDGAW